MSKLFRVVNDIRVVEADKQLTPVILNEARHVLDTVQVKRNSWEHSDTLEALIEADSWSDAHEKAQALFYSHIRESEATDDPA